MALLTPKDIREHTFQTVRFKEGYDVDDNDSVGEHAEDSPHSLADRLLDVGVAVHHYRGAETRFVREHAALHAHLYRHLDALTHQTADDSLHAERAPENRGEHRAELVDMHNADADSSQQVDDHHYRNDLLCNQRDPLDTADNNESRNDHQHDAGDPVRDAECAVHVGAYCVPR